jgi:hypothetical protein
MRPCDALFSGILLFSSLVACSDDSEDSPATQAGATAGGAAGNLASGGQAGSGQAGNEQAGGQGGSGVAGGQGGSGVAGGQGGSGVAGGQGGSGVAGEGGEGGAAGGGEGGAAGGGEGGAAGGGGSGQAGAAGGGESVTLRKEPCEKIPGAATKCESFVVTCGGAAPAVVDVATFEPLASVAKKGVILFGSGGDGTGFYNFAETKKLLQQGFTVVDRRWPAGWFTGATEGPQQAACRLAALIRHLRKTIAGKEALCATGNSGGSAENVYAWTWQGAGASLDFALPTSGPFHRLDLACQGNLDKDWSQQCNALVEERCPDCASKSCQLGNGPNSLLDVSFGGTKRCTEPAAGDLDLLKARSPASGPDIAGLSGLPVRFLVGKDDPGAYMPLTASLVDSLSASGMKAEVTYVSGAPHEMDTTPEGATAILDALLAGCVPRF